MKAEELFLRSMALLNEDPSRVKGYTKRATALINQLLAECLFVENTLREARGENVLEAADKIESLEDTIMYDDGFVSLCMPYGLAALLCADDDRSMANAMGAQFEQLMKKYKVATFQDITNHY